MLLNHLFVLELCWPAASILLESPAQEKESHDKKVTV